MITKPLDITHFPAPATCAACGARSAFLVSDTFVCTSRACDPTGVSYDLLDLLFLHLRDKAKLA